MEKTVEIGGIPCRLKTNAGLPRVYRLLVGGDIFEDIEIMRRTLAALLASMTDKNKKPPTQEEQDRAVTVTENVAFAMHKLGDPTQPNTVEQWLEQFEDEAALANSGVIGELLSLWYHETETTAEEKKKKDQSSGE